MSLDIILKNRSMIEGLLVGTLLKDLTLFADVKLKADDFIKDKYKFFYNLGKSMSLGYAELDEVSIASYIEANTTLKDSYINFGGWDSVKKAIEIGNPNNIDKYYDDIQKSNLIVSLYEKGFSVCNEIELEGAKIVPFDIFNQMNTNQVYEFYEMLLTDSAVETVGSVDIEDLFLQDDDIEDFKSGKNSGVPYGTIFRWETEEGRNRYIEGSKMLSTLTNGVTDSNGVFFVGAYSGTGKTTFTLVNLVMGLIESGAKCLIVSNEQQSKYYKLILVSFVCQNVFRQYKISRKKIELWDLTEEEQAYVYKANKFLKDRINGRLKFINMDTVDVEKVMKVAKKLCLAHGYEVLVYETMKPESTTANNVVGEMVEVSRKLDLFGKKMKMKIIAPVQLTTNSEGKTSYLTSAVLASSKQIKEVANVILLMRKVLPEELEKDSRMYMKPYKLVKDFETGKWSKNYLEDLDPNKDYRLIFIDKNREGEDSKVLLYEFHGRSGTFIEIGMTDNVFKGQLSY